MTYKEFYIWLEGFMTNRSWTVVQQKDIETIQEKMKKVKEEPDFDINKWKHLSKISSLPITINPDDNDELGKPPKIVM